LDRQIPSVGSSGGLRRKLDGCDVQPFAPSWNKAWLEHQLGRVSAKAPITEEIRYGLSHWDGLTRFLDDGRIELDTNIVERGIRPINALFAGHDEGAENWGLYRVANRNWASIRKPISPTCSAG
jgi:hypothetical protein